jgi:hypothetical protein
MVTRREFLANAVCTIAAARLHTQSQSTIRVVLSIPIEATGPRMPIDFVGLSYEVQQLAQPSFFAAQNSGLIREFKALSSTGVLRLGGNTSEFAYWKPKPGSPEPEHPKVPEVTGEPKAHALLASGRCRTKPTGTLFSIRLPSDFRVVRKNNTQVSPGARFSFSNQPR